MARKIAIQTLVIIIVLLAAIAGFIIWADPYQQYRASDDFVGNQRLEIPGVARNHDYNAAIMGSSMVMNHSPEQIDSLFGWRTYNFSFMGATHDDFGIALPFIIKQGKVKHIIFDIDYFTYASKEKRMAEYLWDDNILNDVSYWFNYTSLEHAIQKLRNPIKRKNLYNFHDEETEAKVYDSYSKAIGGEGFDSRIYDMGHNAMAMNFDNTVGHAIKASSGKVEWLLFFPPYSAAEYARIEHFGHFEDFLKLRKHIVDNYCTLPNVRMFDFQADKSIVCDLNQYNDTRHHSHAYNRMTVSEMENGGHGISKRNIDSNNAEIRRISSEFIRSYHQR